MTDEEAETPPPMEPEPPEGGKPAPVDWGGLPEILRGTGVKYARPYGKDA